MPSSSTPLRQPLPAPADDGNDALRHLIKERTDRLASGQDKLIPHDEFWDAVGEDFKELFGVYPEDVEAEE